jgi:hypothetical protein
VAVGGGEVGQLPLASGCEPSGHITGDATGGGSVPATGGGNFGTGLFPPVISLSTPRLVQLLGGFVLSHKVQYLMPSASVSQHLTRYPPAHLTGIGMRQIRSRE